MIIKTIEVKGAGKPTAALEFFKGLNVVAGASNTGKSYIVECIKFILGSSEIPKAIAQSKGYEYIIVTFEDNDGSPFSLQRKLASRAETILIEEDSDELVVLKGKHKKGFTNLSNRFLRELGLNDKFILKSKQNLTTQALTLRTLEKIFVIDETRIVATYSPLGTGQRTEKTVEASLLSTLLTGLDDIQAKKLRVDAVSSAALEKKMNILEELITKLYPGKEYSQQDLQEINDQLERLGESLKRIDGELIDAISLSQALFDRRTELSDEIASVESRQQEEKLLVDRFLLLKQKYESDKSRLLGIGEAADALDSYTRVACPTCGQSVEGVIGEDEIVDISVSAQAEAQKINLRLRDLNTAIADLQSSISLSNANLFNLQGELAHINAEINGNIKDKIEVANQIKADIYPRQSKCLNARLSIESRDRALAELGLLRVQANTSQASYDANTFEKELDHFVTDVNAVLERWSYPDNKPTTYSTQDRDLVIGGTPRAHFGKGYRAIAFSAFVIGLMETLSKTGRHPGFVVLDSPLTTYKQADKDRGEEDQSIVADMIYAFYRDLCDSYKDRQIIIFDNQEPDSDLRPMMNYAHFSKNKNVGRYGFFPV